MKALEISPQDSVWLAQAVKKTALFRGVDLAIVERVLARIRLYAAEAGESIIKEGATETALYFLYQGKASVTKARMLFLAKDVGVLAPGDFFGEMALLVNEARRTATVTVSEAAKVFMLSGEDFQDLLKRNPEFRRHMTSVAGSRKALMK